MTQNMAQNSRPAVFLHSGFRTGSTWFWSCFRRAANTCAFYEPFHEGLADLHPDTLSVAIGDGGTRLRHPTVDAPYFEEYRPLLRPTGGVAFYDGAMALSDYFYIGPNPPQHRYLAYLMQHAWDNGKAPVLGFCRSLGRVPWLRQHFSAINIVTLRKPWNRWVSYRQHRTRSGNPYFELCSYVIAVVGRNGQYRSFFEDLPLPPASAEQPLGVYFETLNEEQRLRIFLRVYVLEMMIALRGADHVVDLERMTSDADYRTATTEELRRATGLADLSFSDCALPDHDRSADPMFQVCLNEARTRLVNYLAEAERARAAPDPIVREKAPNQEPVGSRAAE
jgi:hypothetical protein